MNRVKTVRVGDIVLGAGMPKICIPVMGKSVQEIARSAARAKEAGADLIELRIDSLCAMPEISSAIEACRAAKEASTLPLLFTLRTVRDGGPGAGDAAAYEDLLIRMAKSGACDAIDCELSVGDNAFFRIAAAAHAAGIPVVGSSHAFYVLDDFETAGTWLARQHALGADVVKAAVMVEGRIQALEAALCMARAGEALGVPVIAIAMGPAGVLTRAACECVGSCLTFGTAGQASAPGQMDARALSGVLNAIHTAIGG